MRALYKYLIYGFAGLIFFFVSLALLLPADFIEARVRDALMEQAGVGFTAREFSKSFPLGFKAKDVSVAIKGEPPLLLDDVDISVSVLPLIFGAPRLKVLARVGGGVVKGMARIKGGEARLTFVVSEVGVKALAPLAKRGFTGAGVVSASGVLSIADDPKCPALTMSLEAKDLDISATDEPALALVFGERVALSFALESADCKARVKGLWLEGDTLNARLNGSVVIKEPVETSALYMQLELYEARAGGDNGLWLPMIAAYKKSAGYYNMKIRGTIDKPLLSR